MDSGLSLQKSYLKALELAWKATGRALSPPPDLTLSEWADKHYQLSPESSSQPGPWTTFPYQIGIMDALTDSSIESITVKKSARTGYTQIITADIGFHIGNDPCSMLLVQPTVEDAAGYSKEHIAPMLRDVAALSGLVTDGRSGDQTSTILRKLYAGGALNLVGANSSRGFRRITVKRVYFDETDEYPEQAGSEGDQLKLGEMRTQDAWDRKLVYGSSPRHKGGRIDKKFDESDQRRRFVPCVHCDHGQYLKWGGRDHDYGIKWPDGRPEDAYYLCEQCHEIIHYAQRGPMDARGDWIATNPGADAAGFHIWAAYSYLPQAAWGILAREFLQCKDDPYLLQVFVNTILGESWEEQHRALDQDLLSVRREIYPVIGLGTDTDTGEVREETLVPKEVAVIVCGVDTQDDRLEAQVLGIAAGEEVFGLEYKVFWGDPSTNMVWDDLHEFLMLPRRMERGGVDFIRATSVDNGGHHGESCAAFCRPRFRYETPDRGRAFVFAIRGTTGEGSIWPREASQRNKWRVLLWPIRVDPAKDLLAARLAKTASLEQNVRGPGVVHFPKSFTDTYFSGLTAEKSVPKRTLKASGSHREWKLKSEGRRNEPWDTFVYAYASLCGLRANGFDLDAEVERLPGRPIFEGRSAPRQVNANPSQRRNNSENSWLGENQGWLKN